MNWIDSSVVIDFELPKDIDEIAKECERLNTENNCGYDNYVDLLDNMCKEAYRQGHMTKKQWNLIERRYLYG